MEQFFIKNQVEFKRYKAFTLVEVLITLAIIGIVAALTIPTLIEKFQKQEYIAGLKKGYAEANQALNLLTIDHGCNGDLKCTGLFSSEITDPQNALGDEFVKYFHVAKNCRAGQSQGCWTSSTNNNYDGSGTYTNFDNYTFYKFTTIDGMSFMISTYSKNCLTDGTGGSKNYSTGKTGNMSQTCGSLYIDVNGLKKPNITGRDTFVFYITNGKGPILYPCGGADSNFNGTQQSWQDSSGNPVLCPGTADKRGGFCAGRVMEEGWEMNY